MCNFCFTGAQQRIPSEIDMYSFTPTESDDEEEKYKYSCSYEIPMLSSPKAKRSNAYQNVNADQLSKKTLKRRSKVESVYDSKTYVRQQDQFPEDQEPMYETVETLPVFRKKVTNQFLDPKPKIAPRRNKAPGLLRVPQGESKMADESSITESDTHSQVRLQQSIKRF